VSNDCCSKVCADTGTGVKACQRVSGCQVAGDYCAANTSCCGGSPVGTVVCGTSNNRCDNGQACRAPGTICGKPVDAAGNPVRLPDGGTFTVSSETNCCNGINLAGGYDRTCRLDQVGVPRCFGCPPQYINAQGKCVPPAGTCPNGLDGTAGCCLPAGNTCEFADQCCGGSACVPDGNGVRRCAAANTCKAVGTTCDPNASGECCNGTACLPASELTYACRVPPPPSGGTDGGTPDAGTTPPPACIPNGTGGCGVAGAAPCCSNICNASGVCQAEPTCQPQDATCSTTGDCCTGLSCNIPAGSTTGTCKTGATCSGAGQACSPTLGCCSGLSCNSGTCGYIIG
jgi:hypothetical protein